MIAPITIRTSAIDDIAVFTTTVDVTRIDNAGSCEYRLEFMAPGDKTRGINEIGGNRGTAQRVDSCTASAPQFTAAMGTAWFEEQSAYYWAKKARDYAKASLWRTPPAWQGGAVTFANAEVSLSVLADANDCSGFIRACAPRGDEADGCMRYWPGQNPKIYIPAGRAVRSVITHEYGHYAAGYVFGHMDTLGSGGFKIDNCVHRAFQEGIAETFEQLFAHHELTSAKVTVPLIAIAGRNSQWRNDCSGGEYAMSDPLWEAFAQAVWYQGTDVSNSWSSPAAANAAMANAFVTALLVTRDYRIHGFAVAALGYLENDAAVPDEVAAAVRAIFANHGLTLAAYGAQCIENQECTSNWCDNGEGTGRSRLCMPAPRTGSGVDPCTQDGQCASNRCAGLNNAGGTVVPGTCVAQGALGAPCTTNTNCISGRCEAGHNTLNTNVCTPLGGEGKAGDPCTHQTQCASRNCIGFSHVNNVVQMGHCQ